MFIKFPIFENLEKHLTISNKRNSKKLFNDTQHLLNILVEQNRTKRSVTDILNPPPSSQIGSIISKSKASNTFIPDTANFVLKKLRSTPSHSNVESPNTFPVDKCLYSSEIKNQNIARYKWASQKEEYLHSKITKLPSQSKMSKCCRTLMIAP